MKKFFVWLRGLRRSRLASPIFFPYYRLRALIEVRKLSGPLDPFFCRARGVIHVGAHSGGEALFYAKHKLPVVWIEANPEVFSILTANLRGLPRQKALLGLVGATEREHVEFHVSSNDGASSSIFPCNQHGIIWPQIQTVKKIYLQQKTLPQLLGDAGVSIRDYDILVLDVQGAEWEVLRGIPDLDEKFPRIQLETSNFSVFLGAPLKNKIDAFLHPMGYRAVSTEVFASDKNGKECMNCRYQIESEKIRV